MSKINRVIVYGTSVALAGIETSVGLDKHCEVISCAPGITMTELAALRPDALIFELDTVSADLLYGLSREVPGLLLIGIDPEINRAIFWNGQVASQLTTHDLTRAIRHTGKTGPLGPLKKAIKLKQDI